MAIVEEGPPISTLTVEKLLGRPLNDVEKKNAPYTIYQGNYNNCNYNSYK